ncbi:MarR family transcriptional regulator [Clostridium tetani]|uniref:MarR family transcriptional regulator n=1 Tax=Clostridium tetani TaxID=1513 RepID=UPI00100AFBAD|nr:MarR family transcriptional regulator [Clostridium tetani]RXI40103.1 MarR family transcriptional regulator [Clostridium tetani]
MITEENLLTEFTKLYEKQDVLSKIMNDNLFEKYGNSEVHCIDAIGNLEKANGTEIANYLNITRSAVSKIIRRLQKENLIISSQKPDNKKEIFYTLTNEGKNIFEQHKQAHEKWRIRDTKFLKTISTNEKETVFKFLKKFNSYLGDIIKEAENDN